MTRQSATKTLYDHPSDMEPLLPGNGGGELLNLALKLIRGAERLRGSLHPTTRKLVAELVRSMNSYYSHLIEGHRTKPRDIDAAIRKDFSSNPSQRCLQLQHIAHMEVQREMEARLLSMAAGEICSSEFLRWLHEGFYRRLPEELRKIENEKGNTHEIEPGQLRQAEVSVGAPHGALEEEAGRIPQALRGLLRPVGNYRTCELGRGCRGSSSPGVDPSVPGWQRPCGPAPYPRLAGKGRCG